MQYNMDQKIVIITGANSGIGKAASIQLARSGATIIMACRSAERGAAALEDVRRATNSNKIELMLVDLASHASIRKFVDQFKQRYQRLDVLIHNAANFDMSLKQPALTEDGIESIFATNHISIFLMTHLLMDVLEASAPSRIITVASKGLIFFPKLDIDFDNLNGEKTFSPKQAYYHAKLAQVMYTYDLAERLKHRNVTVNCVRVTNVALPDERIGHLPKWMQTVYQLKRKMSISPECMAATYVYLAADPTVKEVTGGLFDENNQQVRSNANSYNRESWKKLWDISKELARI